MTAPLIMVRVYGTASIGCLKQYELQEFEAIEEGVTAKSTEMTHSFGEQRDAVTFITSCLQIVDIQATFCIGKAGVGATIAAHRVSSDNPVLMRASTYVAVV